MLELTGARLVDGHGRRRRARPARRRCGCAAPGSPAAGRRRAGGRAGRAAAADRLGERAAADGLDVTVPALAAQRRHPRGRPDRGGRAAVGAGEAAGDAAVAPRRERAAGARAAPAPPRRRRARRRRLLGGDRLELPGAGDGRRLRIPDVPAVRIAQPAVRGPERDAHDAARLAAGLRAPQPRSRAPRTSRLFEEGTVYLDRSHGREPTAAERRSTPLPDEQLRLAALMTGRVRPATWRDGEPPAGRLLRRQGRAGRAARRAARALERRAAPSEPFLHPGRAARVLAGGEPAGWLGELHPRRGRRVGPRAGRGLRARPRRRAPARRRRAAVRGPDELPVDPPGPRVLDARRPHGGRAGRRAPGGRRQAAARRGVFDVYAREGQTSLALRLEFRAADRTLTDEEIAPLREKIVAAVAEQLEGRAAWLGASSSASSVRPATRARSPRRSLSPSRLRARRRHGPRRVRPAARRRPPAHAGAATLEDYDPESHGEVDAAVVAYPHGAAAPVVASCATAGSAWST